MSRASDDTRRGPAMTGYRIVALATLLAIAASLVVVFPFGEYAVDDEWAYVRALEHLQHEGRLEILQWNPMSLIGHLAWGWLFTSVFGLSFTVTKLSVVVAFVIECAVLLALLRHFGVPALLAGLAMATLVFDPLHFFHAFQFSTDIPTTMWALLALLLYARALDGRARATAAVLVLASTCAGMAFLTRQGGALIAIAVAVSLLVSDPRRLASPRFLLAAFGPVAVAVGVFNWWYHTVHGPTQAYAELQTLLRTSLADLALLDIGRALFVIAIYVGLFALPLTLGALPRMARAPAWQWVVLTGAGLLGAAVLLTLGLGQGEMFPFLRNKLTPFGYMRPNEFILGNRPVLWPPGTAWTLGVASLLSVLAFVAAAGHAAPLFRGPTRRGCWLLLTFFAGHVAYGVLTWRILFDRHLLMLVPTAILLYSVLVRDIAVVRTWLFAVLLAPLMFAAVAGTHDIHAIARTAFRAGEDALAAGADPRQVEAGYAFDGWHVFEAQRPEDPVRATADDPWWVRYLVPTMRTDYVVSLTPTLALDAAMERITGSDRAHLRSPRLGPRRLVRSYPYRTLWPYGEGRLYLLARR